MASVGGPWQALPPGPSGALHLTVSLDPMVVRERRLDADPGKSFQEERGEWGWLVCFFICLVKTYDTNPWS